MFSKDIIKKELKLECICEIEKSEHSNAFLTCLNYHLDTGGSFKRSELAYLISKELNLKDSEIRSICLIVEFLHNASLVHDDISDSDLERRGKPSIFQKFGANAALLVGDFFISMAYKQISDLPSSVIADVIGLVGNKVNNSVIGQFNDLEPTDAYNIKYYNDTVMRKSGCLICLSGLLPLIVSDNKEYAEHMDKSLSYFSLIYQIYDDLKDIKKDRLHSKHKGVLNIILVLEKLGKENPEQEAVNLLDVNYIKACESAEKLSSNLGLILINMYKDWNNRILRSKEVASIYA